MARARNIKPSFFDNDELAEIDALGRLLFIGMWTICDYKGEFIWREKRVKAKLLPYDKCDVKKLAINLDKSGFIRFYSDGEDIYCNVVNFCAHQNPHKNEREKGSDIPEYTESFRQLIDLTGLTINRDKSGFKPECSDSDPADSLNLIPDSPILNPENPDQESPDPCVEIFEYWKLVMNKSNSTKLTDGRRSKIKARIKEGYSIDDIKTAIDKCRQSPHHQGKNDSGTVYDSIELICRNGEKLEWFRDLIIKAPSESGFSSITQKNIDRTSGDW